MILSSLRRAWVTVGSLVALAAGLACGIAISRSPHGWLASSLAAIEPIGRLWMSALWMAVLPLLVSMLVLAVASTRSALTAGRLGLLSIVTAVTMIGAGLVVTVIVARTVIAGYPVDDAIRTALRAQVTADAPVVAEGPRGGGSGLSSLSATSFIRGAAGGRLAELLLSAVIIGLVITLMPVRPREVIIRGFQTVHDAMLVIVRAILQFTPVGVFSLTAGFASRAGIHAAGAMGYLLALGSSLLLLYTAVCYPLAMWVGGVSIGRFARAVFPAQVFGLSTRSSVAAIPHLLDGCERVLGLPGVVARFVLPMMVTVFKLARTVGVGKLLVLAHLYGVKLGTANLIAFVLLEVVAGGTPGMPQTGVLTAPAYVASGIPLEGLLLFNAVEAVVDLPKTLLNVTGTMTAAAIVARLSGRSTVTSPGASIPGSSIAPPAPAR